LTQDILLGEYKKDGLVEVTLRKDKIAQLETVVEQNKVGFPF